MLEATSNLLCFCCVVGVGDASGSRSGRGRGRGRNGVLCHNHQSQKASFFFSEGNMHLALHLTVSQPSVSNSGFLPSLSKSGYAHIVWIVFETLRNVTKCATFHWPNLIVSDDAPLRALRHTLIQYVPCSNSCGCAVKASAN